VNGAPEDNEDSLLGHAKYFMGKGFEVSARVVVFGTLGSELDGFSKGAEESRQSVFNKISNAFDKDMEGTMQTIEVYKDKIKTLNEKNDSLTIRNKDINCLYETEREKVTAVTNAAKMWKHIAFVTSAITITIVLINILSAIM
jgi:hypothetical protein